MLNAHLVSGERADVHLRRDLYPRIVVTASAAQMVRRHSNQDASVHTQMDQHLDERHRPGLSHPERPPERLFHETQKDAGRSGAVREKSLFVGRDRSMASRNQRCEHETLRVQGLTTNEQRQLLCCECMRAHK